MLFFLITYPLPAKTRFPDTFTASGRAPRPPPPPNPPGVPTVQSLLISKLVVRGSVDPPPPLRPPPPAPPPSKPPRPAGAGGAVRDNLLSSGTTCRASISIGMK